jgi:hypothetical protein
MRFNISDGLSLLNVTIILVSYLTNDNEKTIYNIALFASIGSLTSIIVGLINYFWTTFCTILLIVILCWVYKNDIEQLVVRNLVSIALNEVKLWD